ncbi:MAG: hypothetical protein DIZ80_17085 [endosymbiont of Galathealinum brachiosum]|uniref:Uncharacterized protein n=1 Tax=endosymbiont of Galathealinum brachiosum TaxID=2200906 RepID=A0A370D6V6_9GAMM|nr:MAG: hypothetical protein DIZ80_17085 [endosymbiont of Galathealinum brachiosum]
MINDKSKVSVFTVLVMFMLSACSGGGSSSSSSDKITITASLSSLVPVSKQSINTNKISQISSRKITDWAGAQVIVTDTEGEVVATKTVGSSGEFSLLLLPGLDYFFRVTLGNVLLMYHLSGTTVPLSVFINPESTAEMAVLIAVAGIDVGVEGVAVSDLVLDNIDMTIVTYQDSIDAIAKTMEDNIELSLDLTSTASLLGGGDPLALIQAVTVANAAETNTPTYVVTLYAEDGGTANPLGSNILEEGSDLFITPVAGECHKQNGLDVLASSGQSSVFSDELENGSFLYSNITENVNITAKFSVISYLVHTDVFGSGSIDPGGLFQAGIPVSCGVEQVFSIIPDTGYEIFDVEVNGQSQGAIDSYTFSSLTDATRSHFIDAFFDQISDDPCNGDPQPIRRVSVDVVGDPYSGEYPSINHCGDKIAFTSGSTDYVIDDFNNVFDVFIHDVTNATTLRVSTNSGGAEANNRSGSIGAGRDLVISADGKFVAFTSDATNLIAVDGNDRPDVFLHELEVTETTRVSVSDAGAEGNGFSHFPDISSDGRYVTFRTTSTNLLTDDPAINGGIYVHDSLSGNTVVASIANKDDIDALTLADTVRASNDRPSISDDGQFVAFSSDSNGLVLDDTNSSTDIFVHNTGTKSTTRISVSSLGEQANDDSRTPVISGNGRYVAFESDSSNIAGGDNGFTDIFVFDRNTGLLSVVSVDNVGVISNGFSQNPSISFDGRYITFESTATDLVEGDTNGYVDIFVYDLIEQDIRRVNVAADGTQSDDESRDASISGDGRYITFHSYATTLLPDDIAFNSYVYRVPNPLYVAPLEF